MYGRRLLSEEICNKYTTQLRQCCVRVKSFQLKEAGKRLILSSFLCLKKAMSKFQDLASKTCTTAAIQGFQDKQSDANLRNKI